MDNNKLDRIVETIEDEGLRVKVYEVAENGIYDVTTPDGTSAGRGPVTVLIIRE